MSQQPKTNTDVEHLNVMMVVFSKSDFLFILGLENGGMPTKMLNL